MLSARQKIFEMGGQLRLNESQMNIAFNFFKLALGKNFTQGRKSEYVVASCLYIVCRLEQTSHILFICNEI